MLGRVRSDSPAGRRRVLVAVAALAALLRILYVAEIHDHPYWLTPLVDAADYHTRAMQVMRGEGLGADVYYKAPAYSWLVGQVYRLAGPRLECIYVLQMLGGVIVAVCIASLGQLWLGPWGGLAGGVVAGMYAPLPYFENQLLIESSALFFSVVAVTLLWSGWRQRLAPAAGVAADTAAGLAAGVALQLRPVNVAFVIALLAVVWLARTPVALRWRRTACILAPVLLLLVPTLRHNRLATGRVVPVSVNGGINFYIGNNPDYDATVAIRPGLRWEELTQRFDATDDPVRWQQNYYHAAFAWMRRSPGAAARLYAKKLVAFWNRIEVDRNQDSGAMYGDSRVLRFLGLRWSWLAPLGLVGLVLHRRDVTRLPLHALVFWQMLGVIAFFVTSRYRLVAVPWLGIAAGAPIGAALDGSRGVRLRLAAGWAAALLLVVPPWPGLPRVDFGRPDFDLAEVLARHGDRDGAMQAYERAVARHPDDPDVHFRYGEHLQRFHRDADAEREYRRAADLAPWSYKPLLALGVARLSRGELGAAWEVLAEGQRRGDPHGRTLYDQGVVRERQGRYAEALDLYRQSLARPDDRQEQTLRRLGIARCLVLLQQPEAADVEFTAAAASTADSLLVPIQRAEAWLRAGDPTRALQAIATVRGAETDARAQFARARAWRALGRDAEAREAGRRAVALDSVTAVYRHWIDAVESGRAGRGLDSAATGGP